METKVEQYEVYTPEEKKRYRIIRVNSSSITSWNITKNGSFYCVAVDFGEDTTSTKTIRLIFKEKSECIEAIKKLHSGFKLLFVICQKGLSDEVYYYNDVKLTELLDTLEG